MSCTPLPEAAKSVRPKQQTRLFYLVVYASGLGKANVVAWARKDFKRSKAANCSVDISMGPFRPPVRGVRDAATSAQFGMKRR